MIHICSFTGEISDLTERQRKDPMIVLSMLKRNPRVSTWEMDAYKRRPLWKTIKVLEDGGYIVQVASQYPWHEYKVTKKGEEANETA